MRRLDAAGERDAAIRLIIDFHRFNEDGLLDIAFDATVTANNAETGSAQIPGPTTIRIGPSAFTQGYEGAPVRVTTRSRSPSPHARGR